MYNTKKPWFCLSLLILFFSFQTHPSLATLTTISSNQTLSGDQTLLSKGGIFELGFFKTGNNSSNYYIGMWYKKVSVRTYVWVANRDNPVSDKNTAKLTILGSNLVLLDESQSQVWSTNLTFSQTSASVVAVVLDDGNLILRDNHDVDASNSDPLWQSFDHPTDTWLPGGKIKLDNKTKKPQYLTSWKNNEDPSTGLFSLELDPKGSTAYQILWNKTELYWTSGPWNGHIFSLVPEMRLNYIYNFTFVPNEKNESYFTYSVYNTSIISRFVMDVSGQIKQLSWLENTKKWNLFWSQPRKQCEVYAFCGAFGTCTENSMPFCKCLSGFEPKSQSDWNLEEHSGGCQRKTRLQCQRSNPSIGEKDRFLAIPNMALPKHAQSVAALNVGECESICLNNCSCNAYEYYDSKGCSIWNGDLLNLQLSSDDSSGETLYLKLAASEFPDAKNNKRTIIGVVVGAVVGVVVVLALLFVILRRRKRMVGTGKPVEGSLVAFEYRDLQNATKNFSEKLGGGGFGPVFKGTLADSSVVAVKKLESISQGEKQFRSEVSTIGTVQHVNLVRLRGFYSGGTKKMLVYDYMPNGSLDVHLFQNKNNSEVLNWKMRYQIVLGIARGLNYLHEKCRDYIIHCDIKPENILLDADFCPKVADFGLAKLIGRDFSRVLTTIRGTRGYLAPEWISGVAITAKADVYSYGMMLFEVVSGRRNSERSEDGKVTFFPTWAASIVTQGGSVLSLLDPRLEGNADIEEVTRVIKVASWCVQDDETHRPTMGQVVQILEGNLEVNLPPIPRSLQVFVDNQENIVFFTDSSSTQSSSQVKSNEVSITSSRVKSNISSASTKSSAEN